MSAALVLSRSELSPATATEQLREIRLALDTLSSPEILAEVVDRARMAREWVKIKKVAGDVAVAACQLHAAALRQLGLLGSEGLSQLKGQDKSVARDLALVTDARFQSYLEGLSKAAAPITILQHFRQEDYESHEENRGRDRANGHASPEGRHYPRTGRRHTPEDLDAEEAEHRRQRDASRAVTDLLGDLYENGDPFMVSEVVDRVLDDIVQVSGGDTPSMVASPYLREGVAAVVRHSLMAGASFGSGTRDTWSKGLVKPTWVTYQDGEDGWLRIPWERASLDQLRQMRDLRVSQAERLAQKAAELSTLVDYLEAVPDSDGSARVASLFVGI